MTAGARGEPELTKGSSDYKPRAWYVGNNLRVSVPLPFQLIPDHVFRRATTEETARIQGLLSQLSEVHRINCESEWVRDPLKTGMHTVPLPPDQWRYYVVEPPQDGEAMPGGGRTLDRHQPLIERAARLTDVELFFGATLYPRGISRDPDNGLAVVPFGPKHLPQVLGENEVGQIRQVYQQIDSIVGAHPDIMRAIDMYFALRRVRHGELYVLGAFAIIESLLTHDPATGYDSLTHQISTKFPLLSRRMAVAVDYSPFGGADETKIWKKLYQYRSALAHGSMPNFAKDLAVLKNAAVAGEFIDGALKLLLRHALIEPTLVTDLRSV